MRRGSAAIKRDRVVSRLDGLSFDPLQCLPYMQPHLLVRREWAPLPGQAGFFHKVLPSPLDPGNDT